MASGVMVVLLSGEECGELRKQPQDVWAGVGAQVTLSSLDSQLVRGLPLLIVEVHDLARLLGSDLVGRVKLRAQGNYTLSAVACDRQGLVGLNSLAGRRGTAGLNNGLANQHSEERDEDQYLFHGVGALWIDEDATPAEPEVDLQGVEIVLGLSLIEYEHEWVGH